MVAVASVHPARASRFRRLPRYASLALLVVSVLGLLGQDFPEFYPLRTQPLEGTLFLFMLFGLAITWRHPLQGGIATALASVALLVATRGVAMPIVSVFLLVSLLDLRCGWCEWREPREAREPRTA